MSAMFIDGDHIIYVEYHFYLSLYVQTIIKWMHSFIKATCNRILINFPLSNELHILWGLLEIFTLLLKFKNEFCY